MMRSFFGDHTGLIATGSFDAILTLDSRANSWTHIVGPSARTTATRIPSVESVSSLNGPGDQALAIGVP
jgi:hypothetical protein